MPKKSVAALLGRPGLKTAPYAPPDLEGLGGIGTTPRTHTLSSRGYGSLGGTVHTLSSKGYGSLR